MKGREKKERPVLAVLLTLVMTAVWVTLPIGEVVNYTKGEATPTADISVMMLRLAWLGIALVTIPTVVLSRIPRDKFFPRWWRASTVFLVGLMTAVVLFDSSITDSPSTNPELSLVLMGFVFFGLLCAPAWWFNIIKPMRQRLKRTPKQ